MDIRLDFPFFKTNKIFFDNAATSQKPYQVIDAIKQWYSFEASPVHRGIYSLAEQATDKYEQARITLASFINASAQEIIFTKGTTEGINFIADSWASINLAPGDEIIITELEHHSNILPWIRLSKRHNIVLKYIPMKLDGTLDYDYYIKLLSNRTKLVSFVLTSNALGTKNNAEFIISHAHSVGAKVLVDAAQSIAHEKIDVKKLKADFLVFSGHKMLGPTGIGILYISQHIQDQVEPYQVGGGMVFEVDYQDASWLKSVQRYEAGTPPIAQAIGLGAAVNYFQNNIDFAELKKHEAGLCSQLINYLKTVKAIQILGPKEELVEQGHLVSFTARNIHPHDLAAYLSDHNISVRAGHHCAQLIFKKLGIDGSVRASFFGYNTEEEVSKLIWALNKLFN